jgi:hypothetical protein
MLGTVIGMNMRDATNATVSIGAVRDPVAWLRGREFMLRVLLGVDPWAA